MNGNEIVHLGNCLINVLFSSSYILTNNLKFYVDLLLATSIRSNLTHRLIQY
ncbi:hypothetical protein LINGRAHAP2_LOCUS29352 [Linum grandiflorum]